MATTWRNIVGFETGDTLESSATSGAPAVNTTAPVRSGLYSLKLDGAATPATFTVPAGFTTAGVATTVTDTFIYIGCAFRTSDTTPSASIDVVQGLDSAPNTSAGWRLATNGNVVVFNAGLGTVATITNPFVNDTWYYVELMYQVDASGVWEFWIDGVQKASGSGVDFLQTNADLRSVKLSGGNATSGNIRIDDLIIRTDNAALPSALGPSNVYAYQSGLNSATPDTGTALNTGTWLLTGETPSQGGTSHQGILGSSNSNGRVAFNDSNAGGHGPGPSGGAYTVNAGTIQAAKWMWRAAKSSTGTGSITLYYGDGGSNANLITVTASTSAATFQNVSSGGEVPDSADVFWGGIGTTGTTDAIIDEMWAFLVYTPFIVPPFPMTMDVYTMVQAALQAS